MKNYNRNYKYKNMNGFSLIELLVSMSIGLFLLTGIATSYLSSKKASNNRDQHSVLEDNGRIALEIISRTLEHTNYTPESTSPIFNPILTSVADVLSGACSDGTDSIVDSSIFSLARLSQDNAAGDSIAVVHYGDSSIPSDCGGFDLPTACYLSAPGGVPVEAARIYHAFYLSGSQLRCAGSRSGTVQTIADSIENIQYLYGVDGDDDGDVDRYLNADNMTTNYWRNVVSIQVSLLVRSDKPVKREAESKTFTLLDQVVPAPNDKFQRAVFNTTIRLRNTL